MKLIIAIDVEEDNWGSYDKYNYSVDNIKYIPELQNLFNKHDVMPTYLINYPVAYNTKSVDLFKDIMKHDKCEIGTHIHPWNTPPFHERNVKNSSMLCNLPEDVQYNKLKCLHDLITENFDVSPISFRAGRWGFDSTVAKNIYKLGYRLDTSITPYTNWTIDGGPDYSKIGFSPYYIYNDSKNDGDNAYLLEIPATIGYSGLLSGNQDFCNKINISINDYVKKYLKINFIMRKLNIYATIWLSPETSTLEEMIRLTESIRSKCFFLNMYFHSGSLMVGSTPYVQNIKSKKIFLEKIDLYLKYIKKLNIESIRLSDAKKYI